MSRDNKMTKFLLFSFMIYVAAQSVAQDLELTLSLDKEVFWEVEPIWVKVSLSNKGSGEVAVPKYLIPEAPNLTVELFDIKGNKLKYKGVLFDLRGNPSCMLKPGEAMDEYFNLLDYYGEDVSPDLPSFHLKEGAYSIYAQQNSFGIISHSNKVTFLVKEISGKETDALRLFKKGYCTWIYKKNKLQAIEIYRKMIDSYPNSVYVEVAYNHLFMCYKWGPKDYVTAIKVGEELITQFPQSPFSGRMIQYLAGAYEALNEKDKIKPKLIELADKYGDVNPKIRKNAMEIIDRLEDN